MNEELLAKAVEIRDEKKENQNSATRVGRLFIDVINKLNPGYGYMGMVTPSVSPAQTTQKCFYQASSPGTYVNFGALVVKEGEIAYLLWDGISWRKETFFDIVNDLITGGADKALSAEMGKELATTRRSGLTDNPELNKLLLELYIDPTSYPTGKTWEDISKVAISKGFNVSNEYINGLYVYFGETYITVFRDSFSTLEDAISNVIGVRGSKNKAYIDFSTVPVKNFQYVYAVHFNVDPTIESAPMIYAHVKSQEFEADIEQNKTDIEHNKTDIEQNEVDIDEIQEKLVSVSEITYTLSEFVDGYYIVSNKVGALPSSPVALANYAYKYIDVRRGEQWNMHLNGGSNGRAWALLDKYGNIVEFSQDTGYKDYSVVIPQGVVRLLAQTTYSSGYKSNLYIKRVEKLSELYELTHYDDTEELVWNENRVQQTVVGQASSQVDYVGYRSIRIENLKEGDSIQYTVIGGSSYKGYALIKDGIVLEISSSAVMAADSGILTCDGSYDSVVLNYYYNSINSSSNPNLAVVTRLNTIKELAKVVKENADSVKELQKGSYQTIKILCFGNSFTQDSMSYVPYILKNIAPNLSLTLGMAYIGGCPLVQHLASFSNEPQELNGATYNYADYGYSKSINGEKWESLGSKSPDAMIADEDWDIITFQQNGGGAAEDFDVYFAPYIYKLHKLLFDKVGKNIKIGWLLTQGAYANTSEGCYNKWLGTANNSKKVLDTTGTSILFPFGTAVQNLRTTSLESLGDGTGGFLMADGGHLQEGIGCLTAAYANALVILNCAGINNVGVIGESTRPDAQFVSDINVQGPNLGTSGVIGITDDNCYLAQVAAECAVKNPYEVTDLVQVEI